MSSPTPIRDSLRACFSCFNRNQAPADHPVTTVAQQSIPSEQHHGINALTFNAPPGQSIVIESDGQKVTVKFVPQETPPVSPQGHIPSNTPPIVHEEAHAEPISENNPSPGRTSPPPNSPETLFPVAKDADTSLNQQINQALEGLDTKEFQTELQEDAQPQSEAGVVTTNSDSSQPEPAKEEQERQAHETVDMEFRTSPLTEEEEEELTASQSEITSAAASSSPPPKSPVTQL